MSRDYRKLRVFKESDELAIEIYKVTKSFPKSELFGMTSQLRRCALSVPTNIVEGSQRHTEADYVHFLVIALGSLGELGYLISFSERIGYLKSESATELKQKQEQCIKSLKALINSFRNERLRSPKPRAQSLKPKANISSEVKDD